MKMKPLLATLLVVLVLVAVPLAQTNPASSTTLTTAVTATTTRITIGSATGIADNYGIYIDGEYMTVDPTWTSGTIIPVVRGQGGTVAKGHKAASTVIKGPPGMFTNVDAGPGLCPATPFQYTVSVNVISGNVWWCDANLKWTATNTRQLTYNSLTIG